MNDGLLYNLAVSLGIGLIVGLERGWKSRERHAGQRAAGIRSFALAGLFGGVVAALSYPDQMAVLGAGLLAIGALVVTSYILSVRVTQDFGITTEIALLATFALGGVAGYGEPFVAGAGAIVMALVLGFKTEVHKLVRGLERPELLATLQLLLIAVVVVPLLPDEDLGPFDAINPRTIGVLVFLIAGLSYVGYFGIKVLGARLGLMLTAVFGGLSSSTAVTIAYARRSRSEPQLNRLLGAGIAMAAAIMAVRLAVEIAAVNASLLSNLWPTFVALGAAPLAVFAFSSSRAVLRPAANAEIGLSNPLQLGAALTFGGLLSLFFIAAEAVQGNLGNTGLYATAALAGLIDVDAIGLTLAHSAGRSLEPTTAERAIVVAALVNTASKGVLAALLGGVAMLRHASVILFISLAIAGVTALLTL